MIVNPVFNKSGKGMNSILNNQPEKTNTGIVKCCVCIQEPKLQTCLEGRKIYGRVHVGTVCQNARQISWLYTLINDNFR